MLYASLLQPYEPGSRLIRFDQPVYLQHAL